MLCSRPYWMMARIHPVLVVPVLVEFWQKTRLLITFANSWFLIKNNKNLLRVERSIVESTLQVHIYLFEGIRLNMV